MPKECFYYDEKNPCRHLKSLSIGKDVLRINTIKLLFKNETNNVMDIGVNRFDIIDGNGFSYKTEYFCNEYSNDKRTITGSYLIPPHSQMYVLLVTSEFDNSYLSRIYYSDRNLGVFFLYIGEDKPDCFLQEEQSAMAANIEPAPFSLRHENIVRFRTEEDEEYFYIISAEGTKYVTFSRRFDRSKEKKIG